MIEPVELTCMVEGAVHTLFYEPRDAHGSVFFPNNAYGCLTHRGSSGVSSRMVASSDAIRDLFIHESAARREILSLAAEQLIRNNDARPFVPARPEHYNL